MGVNSFRRSFGESSVCVVVRLVGRGTGLRMKYCIRNCWVLFRLFKLLGFTTARLFGWSMVCFSIGSCLV